MLEFINILQVQEVYSPQLDIAATRLVQLALQAQYLLIGAGVFNPGVCKVTLEL